MQKNLHQIFAGVPEGELTTIPLSCGANIRSKVVRTLLNINTMEEVSIWDANTVYATKVINACTNEFVYVAEYINDIIPYLFCCSSDETIELTPSVSLAYQFAVRNDNLSKSVRIKTNTPTLVTVEWDAFGVGVFSQTRYGVNMLFTCNQFQINGASNYQNIFCDTPENITWLEFINTQLNVIPTTVVMTSLQTLILNDNIPLNSIPVLSPTVKFFDCSGNNIGATNISDTLIAFDTNGLTNGTFDSTGQTPAAVPNAGGLTAKANLISKGWVVNTD